MSRLSLWWLGLSCHTYRNRRAFLWLLLTLPIVITAVLKMLYDPLRPMVLQ